MQVPFSLLPVLLPAGLGVSTLEVGDLWSDPGLKDQHDQSASITGECCYLMFSADKEASNLADTILDGQTAATLASAKVCYLADISGMPSMVTTMFALPKLRKRSYPVLLGRTAEQTQQLPRQAGKITLIEISGDKVSSIDFLDDPDAARARLGL